MILRPFLYEPTACASYLFGCTTHNRLAVVDPHVTLVEGYLAEAERVGSPIVAVFETHVQADHVSGLPALVESTGASAYLPSGAPVDFEHEELADGSVVELGNTHVRAHRPLTAALQRIDRAVAVDRVVEHRRRLVIRRPLSLSTVPYLTARSKIRL